MTTRCFRRAAINCIMMAACLALAANQPVTAQQPANTDDESSLQIAPRSTRIGFVDVELIIENSRTIRKGLAAIDQQLSLRAREIDLKEREFRRQRFDLDRQERVLSQDERDARRQQLIDLQEEIDRMKFEMDRELQAKERTIQPVLEKLMAVIADVAERQGFDLVLRGEIVIYGNKTANLTNAVVEEVDRREAEILPMFHGVSLSDTQTTNSLRIAPATDGELLPLIP